MSVDVYLSEGPLVDPAPEWATDGAGGLLCFEGVVRPLEEQRELEALDYEAYQPMAGNMLEKLGRRMVDEYGLIRFSVEHSFGRVPVGDRSLRVRIASKHRKEGLAAMDAFIDLLKKDVPIWKSPVWKDSCEQT